MAKNSGKPSPGQKGLTKEFATVPRQTRILFDAADRERVVQQHEPFVPGPNRGLPDFICRHATAYDAEQDDYDVPAFGEDCSVDNAAEPKAIFDLHFYKGKKHWTAIRDHIRHYLPAKYYPKGTGIVLDCFSGSGMTGVAAFLEGRACVLVDASPAASFISYCYTHPVDSDELSAVWDQMLAAPYPKDLRDKLRGITGENIQNLQEELDWLFATKCDRCGGNASTEYVVYSEQFQCPKCGEVVPLYDCEEAKVPYLVGSARKQKTELKKRLVCPLCLKKAQGEPHRDFVISTRSRRFGSVPVAISYNCQDGCKPKRDWRQHNEPRNTRKSRFFGECDRAKLETIEKCQVPHPYPNRKMMDLDDDSKPWGVKWRAGTSNFRTVAELYTKRNLWAIAAIARAIKAHPTARPIQVALTASCLILSRMCRASNTQIMNGTYYVPQVSKAVRPDKSIASKKDKLVEVYEHLSSGPITEVAVSNADCRELNIPDQSIDYIFTDPPYVDKVQYGELNFVWESWAGYDGKWLANEIVVNPYRNKSLDDWQRDLRQALAECYRVLKPGRWCSVCFHDTVPVTWTMLQDACLDVGFEIHTVGTIDPEQKSQNQYTAEKIAKGDLVVNCRKPRPGDIRIDGNGGEVGHISRRVRDILIDTLLQSAGQPRDRLWDRVLKRLLSRGQMAAHRFDDILAEVAFRSESGRWFLKEEFEALSQSDLKNEETAGEALLRFARLRCAGVPVNFAAQIALASPRLAQGEIDEREVESHIKNRLIDDKAVAKKFELGGRMRGVEFYDCLFFYLTRFLKGRAAGQTPRRNLAEFLEEYLVRSKEGDKWLYRVPDGAEAEALRKSRQTGLGRRIRQYVSFLRGEGEFPVEKRPDPKTLFAWLKHCANFGLAEEGVLLFDKGGMAGILGQLPEEDRYDAEDYYTQCRRKAAKPADDEDEETDSDDVDQD